MKRFWKVVSVEQAAGGWCVALDGKPIRTQGGNPQIVPNKPLAEALAEEWRAQGEEIDPAGFVMRDMADSAIDIVAPDPAPTISAILAFGETDTLCYRADPEDALFRRQQEVWEPLLSAFEKREGVSMTRVSGVMHRPQSEEALAALRGKLESLDPLTLAPLQAMASLAASLCIALSALEEGADSEALWDAATLEEQWQAELWGRDPVAEDKRAAKRSEFLTAFRLAQLTRG